MWIKLIAGVLVSYTIGAIPTAYIVGKVVKGLDIRLHGSGNVGATNVFRVLGKGPGIFVLIVDILKGVLPTALIPHFFGLTEIWQQLLIGVVAVCGHNWTIFLNFKGGKGIATTLGVLIGLMVGIASLRIVVLLAVLLWIVCFLITAIVSVSSILAAIFLPIAMVATNQPLEVTILGVVFCVFVVVRHQPNIKRILSGQESKVPLWFHPSSPKKSS